MSGHDDTYTLQSVGNVFVDDGALVCDGSGDYVYGQTNLDFTFSAHSMEVLVEVDNLESQGGGTIAIDGLYGSDGSYTHTKFDSIVYNEVDNNGKWILGSEYFDRTDTSGSTTAESNAGELVHLVATYDPDEDEAKLYRNGVEEMSYSPGDFLTADSEGEGWRIMFCQRHLNAGLNDFEGKIMFGAVYDYALSGEDVQHLFNSKVVEISSDSSTWSIEAVTDELLPGQSLLRGQGIISVDNNYLAVLRPDGNLCVYDLLSNSITMESGTSTGTKATFGFDGNFVVYDDDDRVVWHTGPRSLTPARLVMSINGDLTAYDTTDAVWTSGEHDAVPVPTPM